MTDNKNYFIRITPRKAIHSRKINRIYHYKNDQCMTIQYVKLEMFVPGRGTYNYSEDYSFCRDQNEQLFEEITKEFSSSHAWKDM